MSEWYITSYSGRLAVTMGWSTDKETPTETRQLWVHPTERYSYFYLRYTKLSLKDNSTFVVYDNIAHQLTKLSIHEWESVFETRDIKKPGRGGKNWQWEWSPWLRKWVKS